MPTPTPRPLERLGFTAMALLTLSPALFVGLWRPLAQWRHADADPIALVCAALGVAAFCGALGPWLFSRLPAELDGKATRHKGAAFWMILLCLATVVTTSRLAVFMGDATRTDLSLMPEIPFLVEHSCLTAYVQGARLATEGVANLYDEQLWPHLSESEAAKANAVFYAPFGLDTFAYPPPFLLLPRAVLSPLADFASQRAVWYALNALFLAAGLWTVARWLGGAAGRRALLLAPAVWVSMPIAATFQVGNVQAAVVVAAMLALVAFETKRPAVGGALLAFTILSKISPGILVVVLLLQRRFREVGWTALWGIFFTLLSLLVFGAAPFVAFVTYELPRLASGEGMRFLAGPESVVINLAPFGLPFKLAALGLDLGDEWAIGRLCNQVFTVLLVGLTVLAARKGGGPRARLEVWAALLTLASLRSPLAPGYVSIALLWLLSVRAVEVRSLRGALGAVAIWLGLWMQPPLQGQAQLAYTLVQQVLLYGVTVYYLLRRPPVDDTAPEIVAPS